MRKGFYRLDNVDKTAAITRMDVTESSLPSVQRMTQFMFVTVDSALPWTLAFSNLLWSSINYECRLYAWLCCEMPDE